MPDGKRWTMRLPRRRALAVALPAIAGLLAGCAYEPPSPSMVPPPMWSATPVPVVQPDAVFIDMAPPPMLVEVIPPRPFVEAVWIGGYWDWRSRWVWCPGRWAPPPRPGYAWRPPHYERRGGGVVFVSGFWQPTYAVPAAPPPRWPRPPEAAGSPPGPAGAPAAVVERRDRRWNGAPETGGAAASPPAPVVRSKFVRPLGPREMSAAPSRQAPVEREGVQQREGAGDPKARGAERRTWNGRRTVDQ